MSFTLLELDMVVVGQRIQVGDYYGLVKYIGLVEGTEGKRQEC